MVFYPVTFFITWSSSLGFMHSNSTCGGFSSHIVRNSLYYQHLSEVEEVAKKSRMAHYASCAYYYLGSIGLDWRISIINEGGHFLGFCSRQVTSPAGQKKY
jgi:hypothetical protein